MVIPSGDIGEKGQKRDRTEAGGYLGATEELVIVLDNGGKNGE